VRKRKPSPFRRSGEKGGKKKTPEVKRAQNPMRCLRLGENAVEEKGAAFTLFNIVSLYKQIKKRKTTNRKTKREKKKNQHTTRTTQKTKRRNQKPTPKNQKTQTTTNKTQPPSNHTQRRDNKNQGATGQFKEALDKWKSTFISTD